MPHAADLLNRNIADACTSFKALATLAKPVAKAADALSNALCNGRQLLTCGNGGSAADASHMTTEFVCRFTDDRRPYPAICLNVHGGDLTAICNDYTFEHVFERQVHAFGKPGDVLLGISTSGNSENVRLALDAGNDLGLTTIALLGRDGGNCRGLGKIELIVPGDVTARIQEAQKLLIHTLCELAELRLPRA